MNVQVLPRKNLAFLFQRAWREAARLPGPRRAHYRAELSRWAKRARREFVGGERETREWDLTVANELEKIWGDITSEVKALARGAQHVVKETADTVEHVEKKLLGGLVGPLLAFGAVLVGLSLVKSK